MDRDRTVQITRAIRNVSCTVRGRDFLTKPIYDLVANRNEHVYVCMYVCMCMYNVLLERIECEEERLPDSEHTKMCAFALCVPSPSPSPSPASLVSSSASCLRSNTRMNSLSFVSSALLSKCSPSHPPRHTRHFAPLSISNDKEGQTEEKVCIYIFTRILCVRVRVRERERERERGLWK